MPNRCVQTDAVWVGCSVCKVRIKTCGSNTQDSSHGCPVHPQGARLKTGLWVCSGNCLDTAVERLRASFGKELQEHGYGHGI